jgi:pimeloyl-ACP methyl ester carboxylesterase
MAHSSVQVDWTFNGLWPYQPRYLATPEGRCAYIDEGPRSPHVVLLLHGNPTWAFLWRHTIDALVSAGQRVVAPDLLGFGRSDKPNVLAAYALERHVARLLDLWHTLDAQQVSLVVHDWGGPLGLWWLSASHVSLRRLVVCNTFSPILPGRQGQTAALKLARFVSRSRSLADYLYRRRHLMLRDFLFGDGTAHHTALTAQVRAAYRAPHPHAEDRAGVLAFPLQIPRTTSEPIARHSAEVARELQDTLNAIPSLLLWGMKDYLFDETTLRSWIDFLPQAKAVRIENASHYVQEDAPHLVASTIASMIP